jgi:hypothetical protein
MEKLKFSVSAGALLPATGDAAPSNEVLRLTVDDTRADVIHPQHGNSGKVNVVLVS